MNTIKKSGIITAPFFALFAMVLLTNPYQLPLALLMVPFLLLGLGSFLLLKELLKIVPVSVARRRVITGVLTSTMLLVVLLQSVRQLSVRDLLILAALLVGVTFYVRRVDI